MSKIVTKIEDILLSKIKFVGPETIERKLSIIIEADDANPLDQIVSYVKAHGGTDIKTYIFLNSVAAEIPVSQISSYDKMAGVKKLWDGVGNVVIPPMPDVEVQPELLDSVSLIMQHPEYCIPKRIPETDQMIDGSEAKVCIIDTGIDCSHPDLKDRIVKLKDFTSDNDGIDFMGHGTHVAGIIAGSGEASNGGFIGVAPSVSLYIAKVFSKETGGAARTAILDAIVWAVDEKVDVINMSLGAILPGCDGTCHLCRASDWAAENGVNVVVSAGNSGPRTGTTTCPANSRNTIVVGAVDNSRNVASFSSRGPTIDGRPKPDVATPGVAIRSARAANTRMGQPIDEHYTAASGTSMAAPHAAGAAALLVQIYDHYSKKEYGESLRMEPNELKNFMMQGTMEIENDMNNAGRGIVNLPLCIKSMEDAGRIPKGMLQRIADNISSDNSTNEFDSLDANKVDKTQYKLKIDNVITVDDPLEPTKWDESNNAILLGRKSADFDKHGNSGFLNLGLVGENQSKGKCFSNYNVLFDALYPHIMFICGTRGSGKSYTLGIIAEELARNKLGIGTIIVDPVGIFWTMKTENKNKDDLKMLKSMGLKPQGFDNVKILAPAGVQKDMKGRIDGSFTIKISDMQAEDWGLLFNIDPFSPQGLLINEAIGKVRNGYTAVNEVGREVRVPATSKFSLGDLIQCIEFEKGINSQEKGFQSNTKKAVISRFILVRMYNLELLCKKTG